MKWKLFLTAAVVLSVMTNVALAKEPAGTGHKDKPSRVCFKCVRDRDTLTNNWFGFGETLEKVGISVALSHTQVYQLNLQEGTSTHRRAGRWTGGYDLEGWFDLEKLLSIPGATIYIHAAGTWSDGLDASSVGSVGGFEVNSTAGGDRPIDVTELYWEQVLFDGKVAFRVGKLDLTGGFECRGCPVAFDGNAFANDNTAQFLNSALSNNPTIPFPDPGLGAIVYVEPIEWFYLGAGAGDAQADARETGFNTTFHDEDYFFFIFETGVTPRCPSPNGPLQGAYRVGFWYDPQPKERFDSGTIKRDDVGFYVSADQVVGTENGDEDDSQGVGVFARYGYAHGDYSEVRCFWSLGAQYQGLIPTRNDDVVGLGFAQGSLTKDAGFTEPNQSVMEIYYNASILGWLNLTPSIQYVWNPGGTHGVNEAVVIGLRLQMAF